ncbi:MAG: TIGR04283 family arsenosugar biosynthesis glycosyltransferase [Candidatus Thermoplasmatota archaeon]|nr:TIGR04283 family arsenosugar biosynthesis glycosyltransferase [Candidatus Thermoplasmatota archaeon]
MASEMTISVIVPVLHEAGNINVLIDHLRSIPGGESVEIIVVDGASEKDTLKAIGRGRVKKISSGRGRGIQMNTGARKARGDVLLFLHADTFLPEEGFDLIRETLEDPRISGGAFKVRLDHINPILGSLIFIHDLRGIITRVPYGDQGIFLRREVFHALGGYRDYRLFEDIDLMERMRKGHYRIRLLPRNVISSGRRFERDGPFRRLARNLFVILLYHFGVPPDRLERLYR